MTKLFSTLVLAILALQLTFSQASTLSTPLLAKVAGADDLASCRKFVGDFYAWYLAQGKNKDPLRVALKKKQTNFSKELVFRLNEDYKAAAKSPGEIVGLDFDPVLNSQDFADKYVADKVTKKGNRYLVEVFAVSGGKRERSTAVIPQLQHVGNRWVFTNFLYKDGSKTDDLISILKKLASDRKKANHLDLLATSGG